MTRKGLRLVVLAAAVLISGTFAGCGKTKKELAALQLQNENLRGQLQGMQRSQDDLKEREQELSMDLAQARDEADGLRKQLAAKPSTSAGAGDIVMEVSGSVLFSAGSDKLTAAGRSELNNIANKIASRYAGRHISVEGHTDSTPLQKTKEKWQTNLWLSANRARSVADYLISRGVSENLVSIAGHGASRSKGGSSSQDRRVEIVVLSR